MHDRSFLRVNIIIKRTSGVSYAVFVILIRQK